MTAIPLTVNWHHLTLYPGLDLATNQQEVPITPRFNNDDNSDNITHPDLPENLTTKSSGRNSVMSHYRQSIKLVSQYGFEIGENVESLKLFLFTLH